MMRKFGYLLIVALLCCTGTDLDAQLKGNKVPTVEEMLNNTAQGREFWIAMPPNEATNVNILQRALEIYVTSSVDTEVTLEMPGLGIGPITKPVKALEVTTFSQSEGELSWAMEVRQSEIVTDLGLHITADDPISVYVLSAKRFCSEGYLALPTNTWDRRYMHISYYDYPETQVVRGGGFIVVAKEDETNVVFRLSGTQAGGTTVGGRRPGQTYSETLNKGQTYMIRGTGEDRAFDLTGTRITSNKPIGLISFHERTIIPTAMGQSSRDNLIAMIPPSTTWGKRYISLEFFRENTGDYFRVLAAEPETTFEVQYFERTGNRELIGQRQGFLSNAGDWAEYEEVNPAGGAESIRGTAIWEADKPIFVMQYSYSSGWDNNQEFDPFMVQVVPQEQYIPATVFQTPSNADFNTNWFNIIAEGDPNDPTKETLRSIELDGVKVVDRDPLFLVNEIPGTNLHWARLNVPPGAHVVKSNGKARFGGYIYGFSRFESYGWPAAMALNKLDELDTVPPTIEITEDCGEFCVLTTEEVEGNRAEDDPVQIDQGVSAINMIEGEDKDNPLSYNFELVLKTKDKLEPDPKVTRFEFCLNVLDLTKDAKAVFSILDRAGNVSIDSVKYTADQLVMDPVPVEFGDVLLGESGTQTAVLRNPSSKVLEVRKVELEFGTLFEIVGPQRVLDATEDTPLILQPLEEITVELRYTPQEETEDRGDVVEDLDIDNVKALTQCVEWELGEINGRGVTPSIWVENYNVGIQAVNRRVCNNTTGQAGVLVRNIGTADLEIDNINLVNASSGDLTAGPFTWDGGAPNPAPTVIIAPGEEQRFTTICFESAIEDKHEFEVEFESNAKEEFAREYKPISVWTGETIKSAPAITFYDFGQVRVGATVPRNPNDPNPVTIVEMINFGEQEVRFRADEIGWDGQNPGELVAGPFEILSVYRKSEGPGVNLFGQNQNFAVPGTDPDADPSTWDPANIFVALVSFNPTAEGAVTRTIIPPFFSDQAGTQRIDRNGYTGSGEVTGEGIIPRITATGYDFLQILCGTESQEPGFVTIVSDIDATEDLTVYGLSFEAQGLLANYAWTDEGDANIQYSNAERTEGLSYIQPLVLAPGETVQVPVTFTALGGPYNVDVTISHDAHQNDADLVDPASTIVEINGSCDSPGGVSVNNLDFGDVLLCAEPTDRITVTTDNAAGATLTGLSLLNDNPHFRIITPTPITVPGNGSVDIEIQFIPTDTEIQQDFVIIENSLGAPLRAAVVGVAHTVTVVFDINENPTLLTPGDETELNLTINDSENTNYDDILEAGLVGAIVTLEYDLSAARLTEVRPAAGYNLDGAIDHSRIDGFSRFTLRAVAPISREELMANLNFQLYLHDEETLPIGLSVEILEANREECVIPVSDPGGLRINPICLNNGRFISLSGTTFGLRNVTPNPVSQSTTIAYSVGFRAHTNIVVYNTMGEVVKVVVDQPLDAGVYEADLNVNELPAGVYTYTMTSGPYSQAHTLVITK